MSTTPIENLTASASAAPPRRRGTLLIVDDEEGSRQSLRVIFKDNYDLHLAPDGATAIELAREHDVDVAVCDIRMAGMSGIEVLERLKYVDPAIEVVMITAFETTDTIRQALRLRACDYINKPFDVSHIRAAVAGAMQAGDRETHPGRPSSFAFILPVLHDIWFPAVGARGPRAARAAVPLYARRRPAPPGPAWRARRFSRY